MRLKSAQVRMFRNVVDSGEIRFQDDVTCLVGKNESGKTALLVALHRLNPANGRAEFSAQEDYPRWRLSRDRRQGLVDDTEVIRATFSLEDCDVSAVEDSLWPGVRVEGDFSLGAKYGGGRMCYLAVNEREAVQCAVRAGELSKVLSDELESLDTFEAVTKLCAEIAADDEADESIRGAAGDLAADISAKLGGGTLRKKAADLLCGRMPRFFYFSDYQNLPGRIDLDALAASKEDPATSRDQTARALLKLAGTDPASMKIEDFDARKSELEAASNELTQRVFEYWTQNPNLSIEIDTDKETVPNHSNPYGGQTAVVRYLDVRVKDSRHGFTGNFEQRSTGFRWFFSFFAAFSEFEDLGHEVIVLLDEPAMSLHGRAQSDFLRFINERLGSASQVVYTTHSPFMVEPAHLERVRIVEDRGPKEGAIVTEDAHSVGDDATFPLQAALGYDLAQNLLIGPDNLLLEGASDQTYLRILSDHLRSLGRQGLHDRWRILSTHGATNMPAFLSLFSDLDVTILIDGTSSSLGKLMNLVHAGAIDKRRVINTDSHAGLQASDIEDLFTPGEFLRLYNLTFHTDWKVGALNGKDRIIARISRAEGAPFKEHGKPADYLLRMPDRAKYLASLSEGTLAKWEGLFQAINATLS